MKKLLIIILVVFAGFSCEDLTELNKDIKNPEEVPAGALVANAQKDLFDFMNSTNVNVNNFRLWSQFWAQTTYADESNYQLVERNVNGRAWNEIYAEVIRDIREAKALIEANNLLTDANKARQLAIAETLEIFSWTVLVDIFGDIPYTEALTEDETPAYDDDAAIYADLATRLNTAIADLSGDSGMGDYDLIYGGDADMWALFANSLKLRMAIRLDDQAMGEAAAAAGVITDNSENFLLEYQASTPNTNPLWVDLVQSGRSDFIATSTVTDPMNALNDPRLFTYFSDPVAFGYPTDDNNTKQDSTISQDLVIIWDDGAEFVTAGTTILAADSARNPSLYWGGTYGDNNNYNAFSHPGDLQQSPTFAGVVMGAWEVHFLLADAVDRGWSVGGTVAGHYNAGIETSILYWGGTAAEVTAYLARPDVAFATTTMGSTNTEKIAFQKWLSLYDQGFEAWSTHRYYDYPVLPIAAQAQIPTPNRFTYPVGEYSINEESVRASALGGNSDQLSARVFWDDAD